ncbi:MAG TPA: AAA family ATPase [Roseiflexaceae bacterium]|nr:AAA family ATPase [Roseiflexaceae bacterium]
MATELLIVSTTSGLQEALIGYEGLTVLQAPGLSRVKSLIVSEQPPEAIYLEDTRGTLEEIWEIIRQAQSRRIPVLLGLQSVGIVHRADFADAGIPVITETRAAADLAAWVAQQLGVRRRAAATGQVTIAVGGAKGGIGKSLVVAMIAEGMRRRGLRVLVVDGDLSNSGVVPTFRIPSGYPSFLYLKQEGISAFTPENVRRYIYKHSSGIDFLLGSEETASALDLVLPEWQALMQAVRSLEGYDLVLIDTGPEMKKRPYALDAARNGGWVVLPAPPGRKERTGVGYALSYFAQQMPDLTERCLVLFMEPERGVTVTIPQVAPLFGRQFPRARTLGSLPRATRQISLADEMADRYLSPLDVAPHSTFSRAVHEMVETLCGTVGLKPPLPMPKSSFWQRLRGEKVVTLPAAAALAGVQEIEVGV